MQNLIYFNKIIYKGNINRDFYWFCCKRNPKLLVYIFYHVILWILSFFSVKAERKKLTNYHIYMKKINNLTQVTKDFHNQKKHKINEWYLSKQNKTNIIIAKCPEILARPFLTKETLVAYHLNSSFIIDLDKYNNDIEKIEKLDINESYYNSWKALNLFSSKHKYLNIKNLFFYYKPRKIYKILNFLIKPAVIIILSILLLFISYTFTTVYFDIAMINNYISDSKLMLLNIVPILMSILLLLFLTKRLWLSFGLTSLIIFIIGIINKTKLYYRDDVMKFEDITLFKEALIMTSRYEIIVRWYTIVCILLCILIALFLRKKFTKIKIKTRYTVSISILLLIISIVGYQKIYTNHEIYNSVGNTSNINVWIGTRQAQIRGLIYPFVYSSTELQNTKPENYDEQEAKKLLQNYSYDDIEENKKVNVIAIMLEAFNDFSKFDSIEFTTDVYSGFHKVQKESLSGEIIVDIFGGGTINTERQFITGFYDLPNFRKQTNSYASYFKEQGYLVEAMHPAYGAFYNRINANLNMGFNNYWNDENRFNSYNGWGGFASDEELYQEIISSLETTNKDEKKYFNFSVTYQNHGPYSTTLYSDLYIKNKGYTDDAYNMFNNYLSGIKSTSDALYNLAEYLKDYKEPTILIVFGDHNPYLGEANYVYKELGINMDLTTIDGFNNYYGIPYLIYGNNEAKRILNKDFKGKSKTISPNFLMNEVFEYIGYKGNEYLKYTSEVKESIDVINKIYYKENNNWILKQETSLFKKISKFNNVNYYWANNYKINTRKKA